MDWLAETIAELADLSAWGYARSQPSASEPAAITALALTLSGQAKSARAPLDWLVSLQADEGDVGVSAAQPEPRWPTSWALTAWTKFDALVGSNRYCAASKKAAAWLLQMSGETMPKNPDFGHDSSLVGWPWVHHTHSWQEPTALAVMALKRAGHASHQRTRQGVSVLVDRLLETGGCNYGNTVVLGQPLRPHIQPTGLCLLALQGESDALGKIQRSIGWLARAIGQTTTPVSLAYAVLALAAHHHLPTEANTWLSAATQRELSGQRRPYALALLALAAYSVRRGDLQFLVTRGHRNG